MITPIIVQKGRTVVVPVSIGYDISADTYTSQIRTEKNFQSELIAVWDVSFLTDGTDGELLLTLDDNITTSIVQDHGYMDLKRVSNGEPLPVFDEILEVLFKDTVTI